MVKCLLRLMTIAVARNDNMIHTRAYQKMQGAKHAGSRFDAPVLPAYRCLDSRLPAISARNAKVIIDRLLLKIHGLQVDIRAAGWGWRSVVLDAEEQLRVSVPPVADYLSVSGAHSVQGNRHPPIQPPNSSLDVPGALRAVVHCRPVSLMKKPETLGCVPLTPALTLTGCQAA